jgi:hypothetical protein
MNFDFEDKIQQDDLQRVKFTHLDSSPKKIKLHNFFKIPKIPRKVRKGLLGMSHNFSTLQSHIHPSNEKKMMNVNSLDDLIPMSWMNI